MHVLVQKFAMKRDHSNTQLEQAEYLQVFLCVLWHPTLEPYAQLFFILHALDSKERMENEEQLSIWLKDRMPKDAKKT